VSESEAKQAVRERMWALLERERVTRFPGAKGRIPNFRGAEAAGGRLAQLRDWCAAQVLKANPDSPQISVRRRALSEGKTVYMAVPRLAAEKPFLRLRTEATIRGAERDALPLAVEELEPVELVVCGTVAINRDGVRVGKGGGYSDLELALLVEAGLVGEETTIATTVHPLQLIDGELAETDHDVRVDLIVTPDEVIVTGARKQRVGILWDDLDDEKVASIPALAR
jgi:5-formyltetrahydrofolate cyclo-ligase